eukprot:262543-Chlamydomonas_euryale.AAC.7
METKTDILVLETEPNAHIQAFKMEPATHNGVPHKVCIHNIMKEGMQGPARQQMEGLVLIQPVRTSGDVFREMPLCVCVVCHGGISLLSFALGLPRVGFV